MMSGRQLLMALILGLFYMCDVTAMPVTLNANDYTPGTDISHTMNDGILLQDYSLGTSLTYSAAITSSVDMCGSMDPCYYNALSWSNDNYDVPYDLSYGSPLSSLSFPSTLIGLYMSSSQSFNNLSFTAWGDGGSTAFYALLFDKNNNYIGYFDLDSSSTQSYCNNILQCPVYSGSYNLSGMSVYNIALADAGGATILRSLTADVPEPPSLALLAIGLIVLGVNRKRKH